MPNVLDYFTVSPGEKKRAELELQNRLSLQKGLTPIEVERAKQLGAVDLNNQRNLRDSNQLNADFQRHKQERELQDTLSDLYPSNNPNLTADENSTLSMIHAADKMNEIKAAQPLAGAATNMNIAETAAGARPYNTELGATSALSGVTGNEAGIESNLLNKGINKARQKTAPTSAVASDLSKVAEAINTYNESRSRDTTLPSREQATVAGANALMSEGVNRAKEAEAANTLIPSKTAATSAMNWANARQGEYNQGLYGAQGMDPILAAQLANARVNADLAAEKGLAASPLLNRLNHIPNLNSLIMMRPELVDQLLNNISNPTSAISGGLNAPVSGGQRAPVFNINK